MKNTFLLLLWVGAISGCSSSPTGISDRVVAQSTAVETGEPDPEPPPLQANLKRLLEKGYERYRRSDFAGAVQQWEPVWIALGRASDTWTPSLLYYCYLATGQYKKALTLAEDNIKAQPHNPLPYQQMGMALLWMGKADDAEDALRRSAEFDARSPDTFFYLALALQRQGKKSEAEKEFARGDAEYRTILESNPIDFPANYGLAYSYLYRNTKLEEAIERVRAARESLKLNPDVELTPDKNLYLGFYLPLLEGIYWNRLNKPKESLDLLTLALQNSPSGAKADLAEVYHFMGWNLKELGQMSASKEFLAKSVELDPHGPYSKMKQP